jgi:phosphoenolpyruvate---glycerone phosphotransferase subunit DhaM
MLKVSTMRRDSSAGVGLIIVSHSDKLAEGVVDLARQMAPDVVMVAAGGLADGSIGTDYEDVSLALADVPHCSGAVLLYDLGSARMTAELAVEALNDPSAAIVVDAPLVEGAVAAAVAAQAGHDLKAVAKAAESAGAPQAEGVPEPVAEEVREELLLRNEVGLHARPAALLVRRLTGMQANVRITLGDKEADATSVLALMGLGARKGDRIEIAATGTDAQAAVKCIVELAARNFDE